MRDLDTVRNKYSEESFVPYIVHEGIMARVERIIRRLWVLIIILIALLFGTNAAWIYYESQFETETTVTQESPCGNCNFVGDDGDITNGAADSN